jgi:hypothetical protein
MWRRRCEIVDKTPLTGLSEYGGGKNNSSYYCKIQRLSNNITCVSASVAAFVISFLFLPVFPIPIGANICIHSFPTAPASLNDPTFHGWGLLIATH